MGENLMGSVFRVWIYLMMIIFFVSTFLFVDASAQTVRFQHQATAIVERNGGLTNHAEHEINTLSKKGYHGMFSTSAQSNKSVQPGQDSSYKMNINVRYGFIHKNMKLSGNIPAQSEVRANSQY